MSTNNNNNNNLTLKELGIEIIPFCQEEGESHLLAEDRYCVYCNEYIAYGEEEESNNIKLNKTDIHDLELVRKFERGQL